MKALVPTRFEGFFHILHKTFTLVFSLPLARYGTIQKTMGKRRNLSMYIIKNALRCIGRAKGRNVLIGIIALVIAVSACIGLSIRQAAESAKKSALDGVLNSKNYGNITVSE